MGCVYSKYRKIRCAAKVLLLMGATVGTTYAVEGVLWFFDPARHLPAHNEWREDIRYNWGEPILNNAWGFREKQFRRKQPGTYRIVVLGDSLTWGTGLPVQLRYTDQLEALLRQFGHDVEVLNLALSGGSMLHHVQVARYFASFIEPDRIIVGFCYNDPHLKGGIWTQEQARWENRWGRACSRWQEATTRLGLPRIGARAERLIRRWAYPGMVTAYDRVYDPNSREWLNFVKALRTIRQISDGCGSAPPIFASLLISPYTNKPADFDRPESVAAAMLRWHAQAEKAAAANGYTVVTFQREIMDELGGRQLCVNACDNHPSAALHTVYTRKLFDAVVPAIRAHDAERRRQETEVLGRDTYEGQLPGQGRNRSTRAG